MTRQLRIIALCGVMAASCAGSAEEQSRRHFERGNEYRAAGRSAEALIEFRNAVSRNEKWGEARLALADAYAATGQPELAYRQYVRASDLLPDDVRTQVQAAKYLLRAKQFEDAAVKARRVLDLDPGHVDGQLLLANALAGVRDVDGALAQINQAIEKDPSRSQAYASLAYVHLVQGRTQEAHDAYKTAITLAPTSIDAHLALAAFEWSSGDRQSAQRTLEAAHAIDPANIIVNRALVSAYLASARGADAERHLKLVADASGEDADRLRLADLYIAQRRLQESRTVLLSVSQRSLAAVETRLARIEFLDGRIDAANERLQRARASEPNYVATLILTAQQALLQQRWEDAMWEAEMALAADPQATTASYVLAEAQLRLGRHDDAVRSYRSIVTNDPNAVSAKVALSRLLLSQNSIDVAVVYAQEALNSSPGHLGAQLALIRAYLARDDDAVAASALKALPPESAKAPERFVLEGMLHAKTGNVRASRAAFERALELDPTSIEALRALTALDAGRRELASAASRIDTALALKPGDPGLLALSAKLRLARGDLAAAESALRQAVDGDPLNIASVALLVRVFATQRRLAPAIAEFDARAARAPKDVAARLVAAVAVHTQGNLDEAARRYREILLIEPRAALAANNVAAIYLQRGDDLSDAERFASAAADYAPENADVLDTLATVNVRLQRYGRAIALYQRAIGLEPGNAMFHYHLGLVYVASDDTERARQALGTAVRLNSKLTAAEQALAALDR
jgi:tetratricopeptide (TPR) repeat protein